MTRRALAAVLLVLAAVFGARLAVAGDVPAPRGLVTDDANVIDDADERALATRLTEFERRTGIEVAVVTVKSLDGLSVEAYTTKLWGEWHVGNAARDDGVVVLVAPNDRKTRIEFGPGLKGTLSDASCAAIVDRDMLPAFRSGRTSQGVVAGADAVLAALDTKRAATSPAPSPVVPASPAQKPRTAAVPVRRRNASAEESESFALGATVVIVSLAGIVLLLVVLKKHASDTSRLRGRGTSRLFSRRHGRSMGGALADQDAIAGLGAAHLMGGFGGADTSSTGGTDAGSFGSTGGADVSGGGFGGGDGGGGGASGSW